MTRTHCTHSNEQSYVYTQCQQQIAIPVRNGEYLHALDREQKLRRRSPRAQRSAKLAQKFSVLIEHLRQRDMKTLNASHKEPVRVNWTRQ